MAVVNDSCSEVRGSAGHRPKRDRLVKSGTATARRLDSCHPPLPSSSSFCLLDQHAPRLSNTTTCLRLAIERAALHNDSIHNYMAFILSRQDVFQELSVFLNAVVSDHAVEVWTQKTCCPSACQNVIMWEPRSAKTERKKKKTLSRSWRASVPPWISANISANSPVRGRPLPNHKSFNGDVDTNQLYYPLL